MGAENGDGRWYFDMHGAREQSFHEKHKGTVADGMTLRFGAPASADDKEALLLRVNERYGSSPMVIAYRLPPARSARPDARRTGCNRGRRLRRAVGAYRALEVARRSLP